MYGVGNDIVKLTSFSSVIIFKLMVTPQIMLFSTQMNLVF